MSSTSFLFTDRATFYRFPQVTQAKGLHSYIIIAMFVRRWRVVDRLPKKIFRKLHKVKMYICSCCASVTLWGGSRYLEL